MHDDFNPDRCFVLLLHDTPVASAASSLKSFSALKAVVDDTWLITLSHDRDNENKLADLIWWTGEGKLKGILVVVFPDTCDGKKLYRLLTMPSHRGMITLEQINQDVKGFKSYRFHNGLALADRYGKSGGTAIVVAEPPSVGQDHFRFKIVAPNYADSPFFHTHLAYERYNFVRLADSPTDVYGIDTHIDITPMVQGCGRYGVRPSQIYSDWLHQEFGDKAVATAVLSLTANTYSTPPTTLKPAIFPVEWQVVLGAIRLARRMATWTLEGETFECSVLLTDSATCMQLQSGQYFLLTRLFEMAGPLPFNFVHERDVRFYAETAQSDELFLVVDVSAGLLRDIAVANKNEHSPSRHNRFASLARGHNIVLHVQSGYVEVYVDGTMELWHDGFEWIVQPLEPLRKIIRTHFAKLRGNESTTTNLLVNSIAKLMDGQHGSTIIFLHDDDDVPLSISDSEFQPLSPPIPWPPKFLWHLS